MADSSYYSSTAWQADGDRPPRKRERLDNRSRMFRFQWAAGQKLSKHYVRNLVPAQFLRTWHAKDVDANLRKDEEDREKLRKEGKNVEQMGWITHESVRWATLPGSTWRWLLLKVFSKYAIILGGIGLLLDFLISFLFQNSPTEFQVNGFYASAVLYVGIPCALTWGGISLLERFFPSFIYKSPKGPLWELNRRTGMVTVFCNPKKKRDAGKIAWQSPFAEFDCYVHSGPTHQGLPLYYAVLVHRYREEAMYLTDFQAASSNDEDHKALWNFWLQYMDSSAPLPDIPLFEPCRHEDPVTAEYDKATSRNPRYWRDMDETAYKQKIDEMYKRCLKVFG